MTSNKRQQDERNPDQQPPRVDDVYIFDQASGIYKPKGYKASNDRSRDEHGRLNVIVKRDWVMVFLSVLTLAVVALYTLYAKRTVDVMREGERAWVQIGDEHISLSKAPRFDGIREMGDHPPRDGTAMEIEFPLIINNVGAEFAKRYSVWADLVADTERNPQLSEPWGDWWNSTCQTASGNMQGNSVGAQSKPLLPGKKQTTQIAEAYFFPAESQYIRSVYIIACVTYRETNGDEHFTAIMYCPNLFSNKPVKVLDTPEMFYDTKQTEFVACNHEAD